MELNIGTCPKISKDTEAGSVFVTRFFRFKLCPGCILSHSAGEVSLGHRDPSGTPLLPNFDLYYATIKHSW